MLLKHFNDYEKNIISVTKNYKIKEKNSKFYS